MVSICYIVDIFVWR